MKNVIKYFVMILDNSRENGDRKAFTNVPFYFYHVACFNALAKLSQINENTRHS